MKRFTPRVTGLSRLIALAFMAIGLWQTPAFGGAVVWDGGTGDWFGPWLGNLPGNPIPTPAPITNWLCEFCNPGAGDTANIGTLFGSPIGPVTGTAILNSPTTVAGVALGNGANGGLQVSSGGNLTTGKLTIGTIPPGSGTLTITSGGVVNTGPATLGLQAGTAGTVTVMGSGSELNTGANTLSVGFSGQGTLTIQNGGVVNNNSVAFIGANPGSVGTVTVTGAGSQLISNGLHGLYVGVDGQGTLTIQNGGMVEDSQTLIASGNGANGAAAIGAVTVTGAGSELNSAGGVFVGYDGGQGTLTIQNGGAVSDGYGIVGGISGSPGSVLLDAGTWINTEWLDIAPGGGIGTVTVQDGGQLTAGEMSIESGGTLNVDPSTVDVNGDFTLSSGGLLLLAIAGTGPGSYSQLDITGTGTFDGIIEFEFIDGFAPQAGDTFDLINATGGANLSGATFHIEGLAPGFEYSEAFASGELTLTALNDGIATPEPSSAWLFGGGLNALLLVVAVKKALAGRRLRES